MKSPQQLADEKAMEIAKSQHDFMSKLKHPEGWSVHPNQFLPANVECDYQGVCRFDSELAKLISSHLLPLYEVVHEARLQCKDIAHQALIKAVNNLSTPTTEKKKGD